MRVSLWGASSTEGPVEYGMWVLLMESEFSSVKAGRAALQPREMGGRGNKVLQVSVGDGR